MAADRWIAGAIGVAVGLSGVFLYEGITTRSIYRGILAPSSSPIHIHGGSASLSLPTAFWFETKAKFSCLSALATCGAVDIDTSQVKVGDDPAITEGGLLWTVGLRTLDGDGLNLVVSSAGTVTITPANFNDSASIASGTGSLTFTRSKPGPVELNSVYVNGKQQQSYKAGQDVWIGAPSR